MANHGRRWVRWLALLSAGLGLPASLAAHDGDSAIARVAALDEQGAPWLLQLSDGLALRSEDGWQFVCPAAFEASMVLHALSADASTAWVVTLRGLFRISRDGSRERAGGVCRGHPLELVRHRGQIYLWAKDQTEQVICALEASGVREVYASAMPLADLASDGQQLWLVRTAAADGVRLELDALADGGLGAWQSYRLAEAPRAVRVHAAGSVLYATLIGDGRHALVRLEAQRAELLLESTTQISGPVETQSGVFALADGNLLALDALEPEYVQTPFVVDGLDGIDGRGFAFANGAVYGLPVSGDDAVFAMDGLAPPVSVESDACAAQWHSFELGMHAADHATQELPADLPDGGARMQPAAELDGGARQQPMAAERGCAAARGGARSAPCALVLMGLFAGAFALRRRRLPAARRGRRAR